MEDDELRRFEAHGAPALPAVLMPHTIEHEGACIWYALCGGGPVVLLLHGGLGHSGNWGYQVPELLSAGYSVLVVDSRGHGHSSWDGRPFTYERMASDVLAILDELQLESVAAVGWSDGACVALILAMNHPDRIRGVFFFGCNMDPGGTKTLDDSSHLIERCMTRHVRDYQALSATPDGFTAFAEAVGQMMATQPNYAALDLGRIHTAVLIVHAEHDEFIRQEHAEYLAASIPHARFLRLPGVGHFAPLQRPALFSGAILDFLAMAAH